MEILAICFLIIVGSLAVWCGVDRKKTRLDRWAEEIEKEAYDSGKMDL